jgi:hypothetical protein
MIVAKITKPRRSIIAGRFRPPAAHRRIWDFRRGRRELDHPHTKCSRQSKPYALTKPLEGLRGDRPASDSAADQIVGSSGWLGRAL